jgi:hypothetical protein
MSGDLHIFELVQWFESGVLVEGNNPCVLAFGKNFQRCIDLLLVACGPIPIAAEGAILHFWATQNVLKRETVSEADIAKHDEAIAEEHKKLSREGKYKINFGPGVSTPMQFGAKQLEHFAKSVEDCDRGLRGILSSQLIATWTAFETLATDLWIFALNCKPALASYASLARVKTDKHDDEPAVRDDLGKSIPISVIEENRFDLTNCMGSLMKATRKFNFNRLDGIIAAYSAAFGHKCIAIFDKPEYCRLTVLEGIRNVLVHSAGKIDPEFKKRAKNNQSEYGQLGGIPEGGDLPVDGKMVKEFMVLCLGICRDLIAFVDKRVTDNGSGKTQETEGAGPA